MACGEIGLTVTYFYSLTPRQFYNIQVGYYKKQENQLQNDWLQTKVLSYFIYSSIPKKKSAKGKTFADFDNEFFKTKQEYKPKEEGLTPEEKKKISLAFFKKLDQKKNE